MGFPLFRIAENNLDMQREEHEKELAILKEELRRLKDERVHLQMKLEDGEQMSADLQDQVTQLTKHVKVIPELRRDLSNLQNQKQTIDRKMKQQSEEARGIADISRFSIPNKCSIVVCFSAKLHDISKVLSGSVVKEEVLLG